MDNSIGTEKMLDVRDLRTEFFTEGGNVVAVRDISFSLNKGEVLGIVGESGSGKSVTALSIMRLIQKSSGVISNGQIFLDGENLLDYDEESMRGIRGNDISMIFQEPMTALNPVFTIGFQIAEALLLHTKIDKKDVRDKCIEILKTVKIPRAEKIVDEYPHQLSGGMRQRVMIGMSLACNPKLLIADEPTTALDVTIQAQILELMNELKEKFNMSILFITHDLNVIEEMADKVIVMYGGRIVEEADVKTLFKNPRHFYTKGLMASRPSLLKKGDALTCIRGMVPSLKNMPTGCAFAPRCDYKIDECTQAQPALIDYNGHKVRCVRSGEYNE